MQKNLFICEGEPWTKIGLENFDIPMGCYDRAECSELVGLYLLHKLTYGKSPLFKKGKVGLYRDGRLALIKLN